MRRILVALAVGAVAFLIGMEGMRALGATEPHQIQTGIIAGVIAAIFWLLSPIARRRWKAR